MVTMKEFVDSVHGEPEASEPTGKTPPLPGMEDAFPNTPAVTEAAEEYASARDLRMSQLKLEVEAKTNLINLMHLHNLKSYRDNSRDPQVFVQLSSTEKVKVKIGDDGDDGEED